MLHNELCRRWDRDAEHHRQPVLCGSWDIGDDVEKVMKTLKRGMKKWVE